MDCPRRVRHQRLGWLARNCVAIGALLFGAGPLAAQKPPDPEVGYIFPPGAQRGTTVAVQLAGFDWTPDLEYFMHDPRIGLVVDGSLSRLLMPEPPFPVGIRAYGPPPLPREVSARITIPADYPVGAVRWQVANANGTSNTGLFIVGDGREAIEDRRGSDPQFLAELPVTVSGRISRYEEIDSYIIEPTISGPVTCDLFARRLGSNFHGVLEIRDAEGRLVADAVDSQGIDLALTFAGKAGSRYRVCVRDLNFRGHRACVYRLTIAEGPRILAAVPAAGQRGETRDVELIGYGLQSGKGELERVTRTIKFPDSPQDAEFIHCLATQSGATAEFRFPLSDLPECAETEIESHSKEPLKIPIAVTGSLDRENPSDRYRLTGKPGDIWKISADARRIGSPLDVALAIVGPDGRELATNDDLPGTTDAGLEFAVPAEGIYELVVSDVSGALRSPLGLYRLIVAHAEPDFMLQCPQHWNVPIGDKSELSFKVVRTGGFKGAVALAIRGLPEGISIPAELSIPGDQAEFKIALQSAGNAPSGASLVTISGTAHLGERTLSRVAQALSAGNLAPRSSDETLVSSILIASTMKPVARIRPIETDERTVHRGTIHLAELAIERQPGFNREVVVQMDSRQPVKFRQGVIGPDVLVPPGTDRIFYPCLVPDVAETTDAYRILLVGVAQVPDSRGIIRHLICKMQADDASVAITVEGALMKISAGTSELQARPGESMLLRVRIARSPKLAQSVRIEVQPPPALAGQLRAEPVDVPAGQETVSIPIRLENGPVTGGRHMLRLRAMALQPGNPPTLSERTNASPMERDTLAILKAGGLPVVAETTVPLEIGDAK